MSGPYYLGLDVGTQGTKGVVTDAASRRVVARASASYGMIEGLPPGAAEQHPDTWWRAVRDVTAELLASGTFAPEAVLGVGVSGQQHGLCALDEEDRVLRPAKLWCDTTTAAEAEELSRELGREIPAGFTAPKILWMQRHEPELYARLASVLLPHDHVNFLLTGAKTMEAGDASGTGLFDVAERTFDMRAMATIGASLSDAFPPLVGAGEPAGRLRPEAADVLGLPADIVVASGGGDNMMSAIGAGATRPGVGVLSLGTSATIFACSDAPVVDPEAAIAAFCDSTGRWLPLLCVMNATGVLEELVRSYGGAHDLDDLTRFASRVEPGSGGLLFLPFLQGERVPNLPNATGALLGVTPGTLTPGHLFRAALEGVTANLAWGFQRLGKLGVALDSLRVVGGGSRNELWVRMLADAIGVPVQRLEEPESAALGGAIQAEWTCARLDAEDAAIDAIAGEYVRPVGEAVVPDPARREGYERLLEAFQRETGRLFGA